MRVTLELARGEMRERERVNVRGARVGSGGLVTGPWSVQGGSLAGTVHGMVISGSKTRVSLEHSGVAMD